MKKEIGVSSELIKWEQRKFADALTKKIICRRPHDKPNKIKSSSFKII
jgi:hypothetical protein